MRTCWSGRLRAALVAASLATTAFTCVPGEPITPAPDGEFAIVAFGDSLTNPSQVSVGAGWPASLPEYWHRINKGKYGEFGAYGFFTQTGLDRLEAALPTIDDAGTNAVVIWWGTNDVVDPEFDDLDAEQNLYVIGLDDLVGTILTHAVKPLVVIPPPQGVASGGRELENARLEFLRDAITPRMAARGVPVVNLYDAFLAHDEPASLFEADEIHLAPDGRDFAAAQIAPALRAICAALAPSEPSFQCDG